MKGSAKVYSRCKAKRIVLLMFIRVLEKYDNMPIPSLATNLLSG